MISKKMQETKGATGDLRKMGKLSIERLRKQSQVLNSIESKKSPNAIKERKENSSKGEKGSAPEITVTLPEKSYNGNIGIEPAKTHKDSRKKKKKPAPPPPRTEDHSGSGAFLHSKPAPPPPRTEDHSGSDANLKVHEPLRTTIYFNHPLDGNHDHHSLTEEEEREGHRELEERRKKAAYQEDNDSALQGFTQLIEEREEFELAEETKRRQKNEKPPKPARKHASPPPDPSPPAVAVNAADILIVSTVESSESLDELSEENHEKGEKPLDIARHQDMRRTSVSRIASALIEEDLTVCSSYEPGKRSTVRSTVTREMHTVTTQEFSEERECDRSIVPEEPRSPKLDEEGVLLQEKLDEEGALLQENYDRLKAKFDRWQYLKQHDKYNTDVKLLQAELMEEHDRVVALLASLCPGDSPSPVPSLSKDSLSSSLSRTKRETTNYRGPPPTQSRTSSSRHVLSQQVSPTPSSSSGLSSSESTSSRQNSSPFSSKFALLDENENLVPGLKKSPECAENKERVQGFGRSPCGTRGGGERREAPIPLPDYQSPPTTHYVTKKQQTLTRNNALRSKDEAIREVEKEIIATLRREKELKEKGEKGWNSRQEERVEGRNSQQNGSMETRKKRLTGEEAWQDTNYRERVSHEKSIAADSLMKSPVTLIPHQRSTNPPIRSGTPSQRSFSPTHRFSSPIESSQLSPQLNGLIPPRVRHSVNVTIDGKPELHFRTIEGYNSVQCVKSGAVIATTTITPSKNSANNGQIDSQTSASAVQKPSVMRVEAVLESRHLEKPHDSSAHPRRHHHAAAPEHQKIVPATGKLVPTLKVTVTSPTMNGSTRTGQGGNASEQLNHKTQSTPINSSAKEASATHNSRGFAMPTLRKVPPPQEQCTVQLGRVVENASTPSRSPPTASASPSSFTHPQTAPPPPPPPPPPSINNLPSRNTVLINPKDLQNSRSTLKPTAARSVAPEGAMLGADHRDALMNEIRLKGQKGLRKVNSPVKVNNSP